MVAAAEAVHGLHQRKDVIGIGVLRDAVAEVENVARAGAVVGEHSADFALDAGRRREQHRRIQIALQGDPISDARAR